MSHVASVISDTTDMSEAAVLEFPSSVSPLPFLIPSQVEFAVYVSPGGYLVVYLGVRERVKAHFVCLDSSVMFVGSVFESTEYSSWCGTTLASMVRWFLGDSSASKTMVNR